MDFTQTLTELYGEKKKIEVAIAAMEDLARSLCGKPIPGQLPRRRGRKSMNAEERLEVSRRMKRYWSKRRQGR
jgi:hypothetical protein